MNFTIYQVLAFIGALAGIAIVCGIGFIEGRRSLRADYDAAADDHRQLHDLMRTKLRHARAERDISRHNAAQAIEALTEERDRYASESATLQLRLATAQERIADLTPLQLTAADIVSLRIVNKQLLVAAQTYAGLSLLDQARFASTASERLGLMIDRIAGAVPSATKQPDDIIELAANVSPNGKSWLVHGPQACGKTRNAQAIADALGLANILDDWQPGMPVPPADTLVLTNAEGSWPPFLSRVLTFEQAMSLVAFKQERAA